jgi:hypothetical protein
MKTIVRPFLSMLLPVALLLAVSISISSAQIPTPTAQPDPWPARSIVTITRIPPDVLEAGPRGNATTRDAKTQFHLESGEVNTITFDFINSTGVNWVDFHVRVPGYAHHTEDEVEIMEIDSTNTGVAFLRPDTHRADAFFPSNPILPGGTLSVRIVLKNPSPFRVGDNFFVSVIESIPH